jgi:hypothetical protein
MVVAAGDEWDTVPDSMNPAPWIPSYNDLLWPTLDAVKAIGDSGTIEEIVEAIIEREGFTGCGAPPRQGVT